jgi:hypothetical protein
MTKPRSKLLLNLNRMCQQVFLVSYIVNMSDSVEAVLL